MNRGGKVQKIATKVLDEVLFEEKKNYNTNDKNANEMIKLVKDIINREVKKYDFQENDTK